MAIVQNLPFLKLDVTLSKKRFDSIKDILEAWFISYKKKKKKKRSMVHCPIFF
jgi:hypothetical protein